MTPCTTPTAPTPTSDSWRSSASTTRRTCSGSTRTYGRTERGPPRERIGRDGAPGALERRAQLLRPRPRKGPEMPPPPSLGRDRRHPDVSHPARDDPLERLQVVVDVHGQPVRGDAA